MSGSDLCIRRNETARHRYFQNRRIMYCLSISTFMYLWAIYIFPGFLCLFCCSQIGRPILGIYKNIAHRYMNVGIGNGCIFGTVWDFHTGCKLGSWVLSLNTYITPLWAMVEFFKSQYMYWFVRGRSSVICHLLIILQLQMTRKNKWKSIFVFRRYIILLSLFLGSKILNTNKPVYSFPEAGRNLSLTFYCFSCRCCLSSKKCRNCQWIVFIYHTNYCGVLICGLLGP